MKPENDSLFLHFRKITGAEYEEQTGIHVLFCFGTSAGGTSVAIGFHHDQTSSEDHCDSGLEVHLGDSVGEARIPLLGSSALNLDLKNMITHGHSVLGHAAAPGRGHWRGCAESCPQVLLL